ncbi:MBL fold metallo-hydrolase [Spirillospora sp. CA-294931]|uniref:MBL fold metallo-hydrolase n=1 Tax=Spirillospora sp. CA-294931 TaxID=3240042 RepID=UPI003D90148F
MESLSRRALLTTGLASSAALATGAVGTAQAATPPLSCSTRSETGPLSIPKTGMHLVTLGTKGGPTVRTDRCQPANLLVVDGRAYVVDCGAGVTRQMVLAGVPLADIAAIFITHHHSDHNLEFGNLAYSAWNGNLVKPITFCAPPPIKRMVRGFLKVHEYDIETRIDDQGLPEFEPLLRVQEFKRSGTVYEDAHVRVSAALNTHPPVEHSYALRFDTKYGSVVFSGDTAPDQRVVRLARDADWLVHEVLHLPTLDKLIESQPTEAKLKEHLLASHTTNEQVGRIALEAGVPNLLLSHLVYFGPVTDDQWLTDAKGDYDGNLVIARDLDLIF